MQRAKFQFFLINFFWLGYPFPWILLTYFRISLTQNKFLTIWTQHYISYKILLSKRLSKKKKKKKRSSFLIFRQVSQGVVSVSVVNLFSWYVNRKNNFTIILFGFKKTCSRSAINYLVFSLSWRGSLSCRNRSTDL